MPYKIFAEAAKGHRLRLQMSLRRFCLLFDYDPGNISKIERGLMPPPSKKFLEVYASALGLAEEGNEWQEFRDLAAAAKGEFPDDLKSKKLIRQLPALFRTMRGDPPTEEQLGNMINLVSDNP